MPSQSDIAVKYELIIDSKVIYTCHSLNPGIEKENEIICELNENFKRQISEGNKYGIYKTEKKKLL